LNIIIDVEFELIVTKPTNSQGIRISKKNKKRSWKSSTVSIEVRAYRINLITTRLACGTEETN